MKKPFYSLLYAFTIARNDRFYVAPSKILNAHKENL